MSLSGTREWALATTDPSKSEWDDDYYYIIPGLYESFDEVPVPKRGHAVAIYRDTSQWNKYSGVQIGGDLPEFPSLHPTYDIKSALALPLGNALVYCAKHTYGYPMGYAATLHERDDTLSFDAWQEDTRLAGEALLRWNRAESETLPPEEEISITNEAKKALMWVANNFENLWD